MKKDAYRSRSCTVKRIGEYTVGDVMTDKVITIKPKDSLLHLQRLWLENDVDTFPVLDRGKLVGIVSKLDFLTLLYFDPSETKTIPEVFRIVATKVEDIMREEFYTLTAEDPLVEAVAIIVENRLRGVPVVRGEKVVGFITLSDIIRCAQLEIPEVVK